MPVHEPIRSTTQYPFTGMYCFVINLMASCAIIPPRKAAMLGISAVGVRALSCRAWLGIYLFNKRKDWNIQFTNGVVNIFVNLITECSSALTNNGFNFSTERLGCDTRRS
jgi:hypothetical protein